MSRALIELLFTFVAKLYLSYVKHSVVMQILSSCIRCERLWTQTNVWRIVQMEISIYFLFRNDRERTQSFENKIIQFSRTCERWQIIKRGKHEGTSNKIVWHRSKIESRMFGIAHWRSDIPISTFLLCKTFSEHKSENLATKGRTVRKKCYLFHKSVK